MKRVVAMSVLVLALAGCTKAGVTTSADEVGEAPPAAPSVAHRPAPAAKVPAPPPVVTRTVVVHDAPAATQQPAAQEPAVAASEQQDPNQLTLNDTFHADEEDVTVSEVRVGVTDPDQAGKDFVGMKVRYCGREGEGSYNPFDWKAVGADEGEYDRALVFEPPLTPELSSSNSLRPGQCVAGWVYLETPRSGLVGVRYDGVTTSVTWRVKVS